MQIWPYPSTASNLSKTPLFWHSRTFTIRPSSSSPAYFHTISGSQGLAPRLFSCRLSTLVFIHSIPSSPQHCSKHILQYWVTVIPLWIFLDQSLHSFQRNFPRNKCSHVVPKSLTQETKPPARIVSRLPHPLWVARPSTPGSSYVWNCPACTDQVQSHFLWLPALWGESHSLAPSCLQHMLLRMANYILKLEDAVNSCDHWQAAVSKLPFFSWGITHPAHLSSCLLPVYLWSSVMMGEYTF